MSKYGIPCVLAIVVMVAFSGPADANVLVDIGDGGGAGSGIPGLAKFVVQFGIPRAGVNGLTANGESATDKTITDIAFRLRTGNAAVGAGFTWTKFDVVMSNSPVAFGGESLTFATNHVGAATTVRTGALVLPALGVGAAGVYDFLVPLDTGFVRDLATDLVIEIRAESAGFPQEWAVNAATGTEYRVFHNNGTSSTALVGLGSTNTQPQLLITYIPEPATMAMLGLGGLMLLRRRRSA